MSKVVDGKFYIEKQEDEKCELCGEIAELRPYGPNGENICFTCAMKDEATTERMLHEQLKRATEVVIVDAGLTLELN